MEKVAPCRSGRGWGVVILFLCLLSSGSTDSVLEEFGSRCTEHIWSNTISSKTDYTHSTSNPERSKVQQFAKPAPPEPRCQFAKPTLRITSKMDPCECRKYVMPTTTYRFCFQIAAILFEWRGCCSDGVPYRL
eukprot:1508033-Amphidinium_carterae.1